MALTATPPYDADYGEWKRYQELCGEIDEVISIPELVKNGDLCPHQDYICVSPLKQQERLLLEQHKQHVRTFLEMLQNDSELLESLSEMKFFDAEDADIETIFESPEYYVSIAALLNAKGYPVSESFLNLFDARQSDLPKFDFNQAKVFVRGFFECPADYFKPLEPKRDEYFETAKRLGLVNKKRIVLDENARVRRMIAGSLGKLDSIVRIVRQESSLLGERLRMVILTDYIRMDDVGCQSIGVVPIWRKLKENFGEEVSIGVLCGSLILLPKRNVPFCLLHQSPGGREQPVLTGLAGVAGSCGQSPIPPCHTQQIQRENHADGLFPGSRDPVGQEEWHRNVQNVVGEEHRGMRAGLYAKHRGPQTAAEGPQRRLIGNEAGAFETAIEMAVSL